MTRESTEDEPDKPARPPAPRRPGRPTHARPSDDDVAEQLDERTSPFPYAKNFEEWVADETAAPDDRSASSHP